MNDPQPPPWLKPIACLTFENGATSWVLEVDAGGVYCFFTETNELDYLPPEDYGDLRITDWSESGKRDIRLLERIFGKR